MGSTVDTSTLWGDKQSLSAVQVLSAGENVSDMHYDNDGGTDLPPLEVRDAGGARLISPPSRLSLKFNQTLFASPNALLSNDK